MDTRAFIENNLEKYEAKTKAIKDVLIRKQQLEFMLEDYYKARVAEENPKVNFPQLNQKVKRNYPESWDYWVEEIDLTNSKVLIRTTEDYNDSACDDFWVEVGTLVFDKPYYYIIELPNDEYHLVSRSRQQIGDWVYMEDENFTGKVCFSNSCGYSVDSETGVGYDVGDYHTIEFNYPKVVASTIDKFGLPIILNSFIQQFKKNPYIGIKNVDDVTV